MLLIKNEAQIVTMRKAGTILRDVLNLLCDSAKVGVSTKELDTIARDYIRKHGGVPSFLNYDGFPANICTSLDDEIVHGIPNAKRILTDGTLLKIDVGVGVNGLHTDAARTVAVGNVSEEKLRLMQTAKECFFVGIKQIRDGARIGGIGSAIQSYAEQRGYGVVRDLTGHGIGKTVHEAPDVPNYGREGRGERIYSNMTLAIEPMITLGRYEVYTKGDGWTVATRDGSCSAQYENTVLVTRDGCEILTE